MRRLALGALFLCGALASWAGLAISQSDPWWHPINAYGQSEGVSYGSVLPTTANTGYVPADGLLSVLITSGSPPTFNMYDQSILNWREFVTMRHTVPAGTSGNYVHIATPLTAMDGSDTVESLYIEPTNADHTGASNYYVALGIGPITPDAQATEWAITISENYDQDIYIAGDGRLSANGDLRFWADGSAVWAFQIAGDGIYPQVVAFAALPAAANGAILWCSDCDPVSSPCASTPGTGTFAFRANGAWECPF